MKGSSYVVQMGRQVPCISMDLQVTQGIWEVADSLSGGSPYKQKQFKNGLKSSHIVIYH